MTIANRTGFCGHCGTPVRPGTVFCVACGARTAPVLPATLRFGENGAAPVRAGAISQARGLLGTAAIGGALIGLWLVLFRDEIPGFPYVFDFKTSMATLIVLMALAQLGSAALFYGWLPVKRPSPRAAAFFHRWNGRVLIPASVLVAIYCAREAGPQSSPLRPAIHTILGSSLFVVLVTKLAILRFVPRLSRLVPVLGGLLVLLLAGLWSTSALAYLADSGSTSKAPAAGTIGARVQIVDQAGAPGAYAPAEVRIKAGQVVEWTNASSRPHTVTQQGGDIDSGRIRQADTFSRQFTEPGTFTYICAIHDAMTAARVIVER